MDHARGDQVVGGDEKDHWTDLTLNDLRLNAQRFSMADDVKFTVGGDAKSAEQALDRLEKKLEQTGQTAQEAGKKVSESSKSQGADLEAVGQKSERAASSLMQVAGAVSQIGKGNIDLQSLSALTKEATGALGDLGDTLVKAGGSSQALGGALHAVSGLLGPAGVILAGAGALYAVWKSFNDEVEKTEQRLQRQAQFYKELQDQIRSAEVAQRDLNEALLSPADKTKLEEKRSAQSQAIREMAGPGGALNPDLLERMIAEELGKQRAKLPRGQEKELGVHQLDLEQSRIGEEIRNRLAKIAEAETQPSTAETRAIPRERFKREIEELEKDLEELRESRKKMEATAAAKAQETLTTAISNATATRELYNKLGEEEKKAIDARVDVITSGKSEAEEQARADALEKEREQEEEKERLKEIEIAAAKDRAEKERQIAENLEAATDVFRRLIDDEGIDEATRKVVEALEASGVRADAITEILTKVRADWEKQIPAITQLLNQLREAERAKVDGSKAGGAVVGQGAGPGAVGPIGGGGPAAAGQAATPIVEGFNAIFRRLLEQKKQEIGGPLREDEVKGVRDTAAFMQQEQVRRAREEMQRKHQEEFDALEAKSFGEPGDPRARAALQRKQKLERESMERDMYQGRQQDAGRGNQGGGDLQGATEEFGQQANQFGRGYTETIGEVLAAVNQMAQTLSNMNAVNHGVRQAAQRMRSQLPGPGAAQ